MRKIITKKLDIAELNIRGGTQARKEIDEPTVGEYAAAMEAGAQFPPIVAYFDGKENWVADGFHRLWACERIDITEIDVEIHPGTRRAAILHACGANSIHGLPRTNDDKRSAVLMLLEDTEWAKWSDREIARRCAVADTTVGRVRKIATAAKPQSDSRKGADGRVINTGNIGTNKTQPLVEDNFTGFGGEDDEKTTTKDAVGQVIPANLADVFDDGIATLTVLQRQVQSLRRGAKAAVGEAFGACISAQRLDIDLKNVWTALKFALPYAVCPEHTKSNCEVCKGRGWMPKDVYESHIASRKVK
jgi:hypothetical protein